MEARGKTVNILLKDRAIDRSKDIPDVVMLVGVTEPFQLVKVLDENEDNFGLMSIPYDNLDQELTFSIASPDGVTKINSKSIKLSELKEKEQTSFSFGPISFGVEVFGFVDPDENGAEPGDVGCDDDYESEILSRLNSISETVTVPSTEINKEGAEKEECTDDNNVEENVVNDSVKNTLEEQITSTDNLHQSSQPNSEMLQLNNGGEIHNANTENVYNMTNDSNNDENKVPPSESDEKDQQSSENSNSASGHSSFSDVPLGVTTMADRLIYGNQAGDSDVVAPQVPDPVIPVETTNQPMPNQQNSTVEVLGDVNEGEMNENVGTKFSTNEPKISEESDNSKQNENPEAPPVRGVPDMPDVPDLPDVPDHNPTGGENIGSYAVSELGSASISPASIRNAPSVETPGTCTETNNNNLPCGNGFSDQSHDSQVANPGPFVGSVPPQTNDNGANQYQPQAQVQQPSTNTATVSSYPMTNGAVANPAVSYSPSSQIGQTPTSGSVSPTGTSGVYNPYQVGGSTQYSSTIGMPAPCPYQPTIPTSGNMTNPYQPQYPYSYPYPSQYQYGNTQQQQQQQQQNLYGYNPNSSQTQKPSNYSYPVVQGTTPQRGTNSSANAGPSNKTNAPSSNYNQPQIYYPPGQQAYPFQGQNPYIPAYGNTVQQPYPAYGTAPSGQAQVMPPNQQYNQQYNYNYQYTTQSYNPNIPQQPQTYYPPPTGGAYNGMPYGYK